MSDWIPVVSQLKSFVQLCCDDVEGAKETQKNFLKKCPGVAHIVGITVGVVGLIRDDDDCKQFAKAALVEGTKAISDFADGIPGVGHVKGGIHHLVGDEKGGNKALISASRSACVWGAGAAGFLVGGPVGAVSGGIGAGVVFDGMHTGAAGNKDGPQGIWAIGERNKPGDIFDMIVGVVGDGWAGYKAGISVDQKLRISQTRAVERIMKKRAALGLDGPVDKFEVWCEITDLETGEKFYGNNKRIRGKTKLTSPRDPKPNLFVENNPIEGKLPLERAAQTCAEAHAYDQLLKKNPKVNLANTQVHTFITKDGKVFQNMTRCGNCMARADAMGQVPSDRLEAGFAVDHYDPYGDGVHFTPPNWYSNEHRVLMEADYARRIDIGCIGLCRPHKDDDEDERKCKEKRQ